MGTESVYLSSKKKPKTRNAKSVVKDAKSIIKSIEVPTTTQNDRLDFVYRFMKNMERSPDWCRKVMKEYIRFLEEDLLGNLKEAVKLFEKPKNNVPTE